MISLPYMVALILSAAPPTDATAGAPSFESLNARQAVHEGNRRLTQGKPADALAAYRHAERLKPDARQIAFAEGLAQFDLHHFDKAREAFRRAAVGKTDRLGLDAMYGLGATDHAEALAHADDPATAVGLLESAMRQYHDVLDEQPDHALARSANYKAARLWQQIKQQQKQQQQQQQQNSDQDNKDQEKDKKPGEQQENKESPKDEQKKDQPSPQESEDQQQPADEQQASPSQADQDEKNEQHNAAQEEKRVPQEQAQRQLREMMQALRERNKARRQTTRKVPIGAVDKDW